MSGYPLCATDCIAEALPQSSCIGEDLACLCADVRFNGQVEACVTAACTVKESLIVANTTWTSCGFPLADNTALPRFLAGFLFLLPALFILARLLNKKINPSPWGADDTCIMFAFVRWARIFNFHYPNTSQAFTLAMMPMIYRRESSIPVTTKLFSTDQGSVLALGLGKDIWTLQPHEIIDFLKILFVTELVYTTTIALIKASILFFFLRIFPSMLFRKAVWATLGLNAASALVYFILIFVQCRPLSVYWLGWDGEHPGVCVNFDVLVLWHAGFNILLDVWMLILPLTQLYKLNFGLKRKIGVMLIFSVGILRSLTAVTCIRVPTLIHYATVNNITSEALWVYVWTLAELDVGVSVACMPAAGQLLRRLFGKVDRGTENSGSPVLSAPTSEMAASPKKSSEVRDILLSSSAKSVSTQRGKV
ncbi:Putative extracellular membrane protein, CFEM [Colletotrichum destructivum]|uniref:Extracellular membrane protein, CFEM n=1 Tax=Colletotrichum destructivum TaxID=34406 RepID=A0AAX4IMQ8_9PEZI|nr:Putative extracellular membrane protein, CFEM [Colletotrichum destructivum]